MQDNTTASTLSWEARKTRADALLRLWDLPGVVASAPEILKLWLTCGATPGGGDISRAGFQLLLHLHDHCGATLHWSLCAAAVAQDTVLQHVTLAERLRAWQKALASRPHPCCAQAGAKAGRVFVALLFHGSTILTAPHAAAVAELLYKDADIDAAKLYRVYEQADGVSKPSQPFDPLARRLEPHAFVDLVKAAYSARPAGAYRAALAVGCIGVSPSAEFPALEKPRECLALKYARAVDRKHS